MTVGFFSPLPPARTGVAEYAADLLAELRKQGRVEVAPAVCDTALYQIGNNGLHAEIYRRALMTPGVVVLHDAVLHHFLLGYLDEPGYLEEFVYNYGEWNRGLACELWRARAASANDRRYFDHPLLKRIAQRARAVVVHNPEAARVVRQHAPEALVVEIPHLYVPSHDPPGAAEAMRWRQRAGVDPAAFLFGVFGYLRESKRLAAVLEAFGDVHRVCPRTALLVAGQFVSSDLERAVQPMLSGPGVVRRPHLAEREFWLAARSVDACVNLRYPSAGETSGIAIRMMGLGKAVLLTESAACARFPEDACVRVASGVEEGESLRQHMIMLASMPEVVAKLGDRAAAHIRECHGLEAVAARYWEVLRQAAVDRQPPRL